MAGAYAEGTTWQQEGAEVLPVVCSESIVIFHPAKHINPDLKTQDAGTVISGELGNNIGKDRTIGSYVPSEYFILWIDGEIRHRKNLAFTFYRSLRRKGIYVEGWSSTRVFIAKPNIYWLSDNKERHGLAALLPRHQAHRGSHPRTLTQDGLFVGSIEGTLSLSNTILHCLCDSVVSINDSVGLCSSVAHFTPLKAANYYLTQREKGNRPSEPYHEPFGTLNTVYKVLYLGFVWVFAYGVCCYAGCVMWRRWRADRLNFWGVLYGVLLYALAGVVIWHGFTVTQKLLTSNNYCNTVIPMANVLNKDKQIAVISALAEGSSIRSIERITGVHRDTVMRLGVKVGQGCRSFMDAKMRNLSCRYLEFDEIWGFIGKKDKHVTVDDSPEMGDVWTFCAVDADTKLVPVFRCGKRDRATADAFVKDVAGRMTNRVQISTDGLRAYVEAIEKSFGADVDYAQIVKTYTHDVHMMPNRRYSAPEMVSTEVKIFTGTPDIDRVSTSYVERLNATTRLHMRRLTRLTLAFSKKRENFEAAVALHFAYYNFVKRHGTLRCTPAMAAGVENSFLTVGDLIEAAV